MALLENELARRGEKDGVVVRAVPLRVRWDLAELVSADGHELRCTFACSVRATEGATDREMLREVLLDGRRSVMAEDVAEHFAPALRSAAAKLAATRDAADWVSGESDGAMIDGLRASAKSIAFGCGLELLAPFEAHLQSPSYERQKLEAMQQKLAEQRAAGQIEHVQRAAELLRHFEGLRRSAPELSPGKILEQLSPSDRGSMLQTLLLASAKQETAQRLWAVAGPYLVHVDAHASPPQTALHTLPPGLGPLRSVQPAVVNDERVLLVGARGGFLLVNPDVPGEAESYAAPGIESQLGFNRIVYWGPGKGFWGTHGEGGLVGWMPGERAEPSRAIPLGAMALAQPPAASTSISMTVAAQGPRNLTVLDDRHLIFTIGGGLYIFDGHQTSPLASGGGGDVLVIVAGGKQVFVVYEDSTVCTLDPMTRQVECIQRRGVQLRAAGGLPWLGSTRLLLAADQGPIDCIGSDDPLVTQYASPYRGMRVVKGSLDLVAAVSPDRQRLVLWNSWDGRRPLAELYLGGLTRHRVADVAFA